MSGHSQFKNIIHRKGAQDAKRARIFAKLIRELTVSAKTGLPNPALNPRLRAAIQAARVTNVPKDTIERAIKRGVSNDSDTNYEDVRYEGYGPGSASIIVEALTNNRNRTASEIRLAFSKYGGSLSETNSVSFMFSRIGTIRYPIDCVANDLMFEIALESGADDVKSDEYEYIIICASENLNKVRDILEKNLGSPTNAILDWAAQNRVEITNEQIAQNLTKLLDTLEDNDDVQRVRSNFYFSQIVTERLSS
ncbi:MAG: YebC/PmpR family DNA-binding transcriptional regulator [Rhodospirillaceae bacterium]|jgi:YebC/PmpR family DNA-binding regulatory protein|nr:YebC/PmpR family DNA-binding transcriptional regulator [Rhodospirillaceae bacterium]